MTSKQEGIAKEIRDLREAIGLDRACLEWAKLNLPSNLSVGAQYAKACYEEWLATFRIAPQPETGYARDCTEDGETWGASHNEGWMVE